MEGGERISDEMEGRMHVLGSEKDVAGYIEGQDQMELCSGDYEQGLGPQSVQEHKTSVEGGIIGEHSWLENGRYRLHQTDRNEKIWFVYPQHSKENVVFHLKHFKENARRATRWG